ncbi:MAG TPA: hypothetical protein DCE18_19495 [Syntrophobacteraceae bacterium]|nr:hypothetical protein [Syntrophobacteraceae bacterium]
MSPNAHIQISRDWHLHDLPPEGHADVGPFFYKLFEDSMWEKERLGLPERWFENHRIYRGDLWNKNRTARTKSNRDKVSINLIFSNIQRTVANLTARNPIAEVVSTDGIKDGADQLMSQKMKQWWADTEQGVVLTKSALTMEIYGTIWEKGVPDIQNNRLKVVSLDNFAAFPAPGYYESVQDMPYFGHAYALPIKEIEAIYGVDGVEADDTYSLLGEDREDNTPIPAGSRYGVMNAPGNFSNVSHPVAAVRDVRQQRGMVVEVWIKDYTKEKIKVQQLVEMVGSERSGGKIIEEAEATIEQDKYPGNIRMVAVTNRGHLVCHDTPNPNVNPALPREVAEKTYLFDKFPFSKACSYEDAFSLWGFSAAEQTDDLNFKINEILSRIANYIRLVCLPPLILPEDCLIKTDKVTTRGGLVLRPKNHVVGGGIRYLQVPSLPADFFRLVDLYLNFFDRIYAIEDVDRGQTPRNIQAASAIVTLQERNAVLMRQKIRAVDYLVRERGRWEISFIQNFSWKPESIEVQDVPTVFRGTDYAGRLFNYLVESGSTVAKTDLQRQDQAMELFKAGAIDKQALLEAVNFDGWRSVIERMGENELDQALNILVQSGMPEEAAMSLKQQLMLSQGGPGDAEQPGQPQPNPPQGVLPGPGMAPGVQPGMPRAMQGAGQPPVGQMQPSVVGV